MMRRHFSLAALALALGAAPAVAGERPAAVLYKNPQCSCCEGYANYLRQNGYEVTVKPTHDLSLIKRQNGVPEALEGCHTTLIGNYVVEGHVPVAAVNRLLDGHPAIKGISLPGMPAGSPGMFGEKEGAFTIYEIGEGAPKVFTTE
jgi:hypothetical protein